MGLFGGKNSFFSKPFGSGKGSVAEFFSPTDPRTGAARHKITGFDPTEVRKFSEAAGTLASARRRVETESLAPKLKTKMLTTQEINRQLRGETKSPFVSTADQMKGFISAFTQRQDEVFGRRARPGISQTRLV